MKGDSNASGRSFHEAGGWVVEWWDALAAPVRDWRSRRRTESSILSRFPMHTAAQREQHDRTGICPVCTTRIVCRNSALIAIDVVALITQRDRDEIARFIEDNDLWRKDWQAIATAMEEQTAMQEQQ